MDKQLNTGVTLPTLTNDIIDACKHENPEFAYLYAQLQQTDPCAAMWLRDETEYLAPANPAEKEKYAVLALKLHYMLQRAVIK